MAGPVQVDLKSGGLKMWLDSDVANKLNGLATIADVLQGEKREGAVVMLKAVCATFGLTVSTGLTGLTGCDAEAAQAERWALRRR